MVCIFILPESVGYGGQYQMFVRFNLLRVQLVGSVGRLLVPGCPDVYVVNLIAWRTYSVTDVDIRVTQTDLGFS